MIRIGGLSLIQSHTLLIPATESAFIQINPEDAESPLEVEIRFIEEELQGDEKKRPKSGLSIEPKDDYATITFKNWTSPLGSSLQKAIPFASSEEGDEILLMASANKSGDVYVLNIQFLRKEASDE